MRLTALAAAAGLAAAACTAPGAGAPDPEPSPRYTFWRPAPVEAAPEPSETVAAAPAEAWRAVEPDNLLIMDLRDGSRIAIELAADFAPVHVANLRALARGGWWDGAAIYRIQENYVAQWGQNESQRPLPAGVVKAPPAEYERALAGLPVRPLGFPDSYAPIVGHVDSWPVGYDPERGFAWLAHCYGAVGVGRDLSPDTGTGGELYAVIGHAPRHLDRNIAVVGRVIDNMPALSARPRGTEALGFIKDPKQHVPIARVRLAADMPAAERPQYEVLRSGHESFSAYVTGRANRGGDFFDVPAGGVDLCNVNVPIRRRPAS
jgi:peptidylprolyl isomerase